MRGEREMKGSDKRCKRENSRSRVLHFDIFVTIFILVVIIVVVFLGFDGNLFLDIVGVDVEGSLVLGVELVVHGEPATTHQSGDLLDSRLDESLRLMQALLESLERPVAILLEAVCEEIEQFFLADADSLLLLFLDRLLCLGGFDEAAEGLIGLGVGVHVCFGTGFEACCALGVEHFHKTFVGKAAVFVVLDSGDGHLIGDIACEGGLFCGSQYRMERGGSSIDVLGMEEV